MGHIFVNPVDAKAYMAMLWSVGASPTLMEMAISQVYGGDYVMDIPQEGIMYVIATFYSIVIRMVL